MSKAKRRATPKPSFWEANRGNIITVATIAVLAVILFGAISARHGGATAVALNDGETNAIGSQVSAHPSDTDIIGIQAAEQGTLNEPALAWFHADW